MLTIKCGLPYNKSRHFLCTLPNGFKLAISDIARSPWGRVSNENALGFWSVENALHSLLQVKAKDWSFPPNELHSLKHTKVSLKTKDLGSLP